MQRLYGMWNTIPLAHKVLVMMKNVVVVGMVLVATGVAAQQSPIKGNSPELTAQMAKRNTAVFEENKGQMKDQHWQPRPDVLFNGSAQGMHYYIRDNGMSYQLSRVESWKEEEDDRFDMPGKEKRQVPDEMGTYRVDVEWTDFNPDFTVEKGKELDGYTNYYNVPEGVVPALFVKQYESVTLKGLWPGIDLRCYSTDGMLETDWLVAPGADYSQIRFEVKGAELSTDSEGHLIMNTPFGEIREGGLKVFQEGRQLEARWVISPLEGKVPGGVVSFEVMGHDPMLAMRIDPVVRVWGTYYGGGSLDYGLACATNSENNVFLAGFTQSNTAIAEGGHQNSISSGGSNDAFLVKFNAEGVRQWATYYGGGNQDEGRGCAVDESGGIYLAGSTYSTSGIAANGHQNSIGGVGDAFLVKFDGDGILQWATYFGGAETDMGHACASDGEGNIYLAGYTFSSTDIASNGHQNSLGGNNDAFLVKFNTDGVRQWATYYGGENNEVSYSCATDINGNVFLSGETRSIASIAWNGHQNSIGGDRDAFIVKFNSAGVRQWGSYYGGTEWDGGWGCAADIGENVYLTGNTLSVSSIASNGFQNAYGGNEDAFIVKFDSQGLRLWSTYFGGSEQDFGLSCALDIEGFVYVAGQTSSATAIASNGYQNSLGGTDDAFLIRFNSMGALDWTTYYGGIGHDEGRFCVVDAMGSVYLVGETESPASIAWNGHQNTYGGDIRDAFVVKFINESSPVSAEANEHIATEPSVLSAYVCHSVLYLESNDASDAVVEILDMNGRLVFRKKVTQFVGKTGISIMDIADGLYIMSFSTTHQRSVLKFIK
jgi:hypothetical protein